MESRWVINVAQFGTITRKLHHFFRVEITGDYTGTRVREVYESLKARYAETEFEISVTRWEASGTEVDTSMWSK